MPAEAIARLLAQTDFVSFHLPLETYRDAYVTMHRGADGAAMPCMPHAVPPTLRWTAAAVERVGDGRTRDRHIRDAKSVISAPSLLFRTMSLPELPCEAIVRILEPLSLADLWSVALTCRTFHLPLTHELTTRRIEAAGPWMPSLPQRTSESVLVLLRWESIRAAARRCVAAHTASRILELNHICEKKSFARCRLESAAQAALDWWRRSGPAPPVVAADIAESWQLIQLLHDARPEEGSRVALAAAAVMRERLAALRMDQQQWGERHRTSQAHLPATRDGQAVLGPDGTVGMDPFSDGSYRASAAIGGGWVDAEWHTRAEGVGEPQRAKQQCIDRAMLDAAMGQLLETAAALALIEADAAQRERDSQLLLCKASDQVRRLYEVSDPGSRTRGISA